MPHKYLIKEFQEFARSASDARPLMQYVSERIHKHIPRYNWAGFYLLDPMDRSTLVLGPHTGSFTPNPAVPLGHGLCGAVFSNLQILVVDDVADDPRYVCVSDIVKSHISVPLLSVVNLSAYSAWRAIFSPHFKLAWSASLSKPVPESW